MKLAFHDGEHGTAMLSADKKYRYRLTRHWGDGQGIRIVWIMLNPSVADHETNDPTITRCIGFSKRLGSFSLVVVNLFAYRATEPKELLRVDDPVGPDNLAILGEATLGCNMAIAAWGALSNELWMKAKEPLAIIKRFNGLKCLGRTKAGSPRHPLYLPAGQLLEPWPS
ncbi:MAG: DUF1643 domain-containing protein [Thermoplasmata archaeon]